jgi:hypothetical protein
VVRHYEGMQQRVRHGARCRIDAEIVPVNDQEASAVGESAHHYPVGHIYRLPMCRASVRPCGMLIAAITRSNSSVHEEALQCESKNALPWR